MTQEQKELLLKDLCARLPYGVKGQYLNSNDPLLKAVPISYGSLSKADGMVMDGSLVPWLFPLSSMTDELWDKEFTGCGITEFTRDSFKYGCETLEFNNSNPHLSNMVKFINQLIKNHFDIYDLIPKGLANDATGKNIY